MKKPTWSSNELPSREKKLIFVNADWKIVAYKIYINNISVYIGLGVTDGCRFGGNDECVNDIFFHGKNLPNIINKNHAEYWITDHFPHTSDGFKDLKSGDYIEAKPFRFRKIATLLPMWGFYAGPYAGPALFKLIFDESYYKSETF